MIDSTIKILACCMQDAYDSCETREEAIRYVDERWRGISHIILKAMWEAIDTYVDMSPTLGGK